MDPTLAALIGAAIGMAGTVLAPMVTSRRAHTARRREAMREAYLEAMRVVSDFPRSRTRHDLDALKNQLFEAELHVRLVGSRATSAKFDLLAEIIEQWIVTTGEEARRLRLKSAERRAAEAFPSDKRDEVAVAHGAFVTAARRDMGMEDALVLRLWRRVRKKRPEG